MKRNREELENLLILFISRGVLAREADKNTLYEKLSKYGFTDGYVKGLIGDKTKIINARNEELYLFTKAFYELIGLEQFNPNGWYYEEEIKNGERYIIDKYARTNKVIIDNVIQVSNYEYIVVKFPYKKMGEISDSNSLYYNEKTQRETKLVKVGDDYISLPKSNQEKINNMIDMMHGVFEANMLTLNIRKIEGQKQDFEYNPQTKQLVINIDNEKTYLDIIDGWHRWMAAVRAVRENPYNENYFHVKIYNITESRAKAILAREEKATPMDVEHVASLETRDPYVSLVDDINNHELKNELYNKIAMNTVELKAGNKYITTELFAKTLKENFKVNLTTVKAREQLQQYLILFFNEVVGVLSEKRNRDIFNQDLFVGYIIIAGELQGNKEWEEKLGLILSQVDFSDKKLYNMNIQEIIQYFRKVANQYV